MQFWKFQGTGNDFIIIDNYDDSFSPNVDYIQHLCHRHLGIGADGLITLNKSDTADFAMTYYNSDGHEGTMCGNGGRCIVAFAYMLGVIKKSTTVFEATDGLHKAFVEIHKNNSWYISLQLNDINHAQEIFNDTGSPHHIEFVDDINNIDIKERGRQIRYSPDYKSIGGVNVNFAVVENQTIHMRTYERGVEAETLSCGTGTTATVIAYAVKEKIAQGPVSVKTKGGTLTVNFKKSGRNTFSDIWLEGPAVNVFKGEFNE